MDKFELNWTSPPTDIDALDFLAERTSLSRSRLKDAMTKGAVWIERQGKQKRLRRAKSRLTPAERIAVFYDPAILSTKPPHPECMADLGEFSIWIKPSGLLSGGSRFGDHCSIQRVIERTLDRPTFLVHRLDRFVHGVMVFAHSRKIAAALSKQFETRVVNKTYRAVVHGVLTDRLVLTTPVDGKYARSTIMPIESTDTITLVNVDIETGRKHQIRVHLSEAGYPVLGDRLHGSKDTADMQLASIELGFEHPVTGEQLNYTLPDELCPVLKPAN